MDLSRATFSAKVEGLTPMARPQLRPINYLLTEGRRALAMSQSGFGYALGASQRTAQRWDAGQSHPGEDALRKLAALLMPRDPALAAEAAAHIGETLESLGLAPPPAAAPPPPQAPPIRAEDLVDIVVCAAADASDTSPRDIRPVLHVAFQRARQVGLTVEQVERALTPPSSSGSGKSPEKGKEKRKD